MIGTIDEKNGWIYVNIERPPDWKLPTFFPLVDAMFKEIKAAWDSNPRKILFDVGALEYIDSTMVSLFLQTARFDTADKNAIIARLHTRELLCLLGIDKLFNLYNGIDEWAESAGEK